MNAALASARHPAEEQSNRQRGVGKLDDWESRGKAKRGEAPEATEQTFPENVGLRL
jgi:hypothetical protein